eukprot:s2350_g3.t1
MRRRAVCSPVLPFVAGLGVPKFSDDATPAKPLPPRRLHRWKASFWSSPAACKGHEGSQALSRKHSDDPSHVLQWHRTRGGFVHESIQATQLPGLGWALCARADIGKDAVLVTTPAKLLWVARECHAPAGVHPLAPGEELPGASMLLRRRLVDAVAKPSPFVKAMQPPGSIPLQLAAGSLADGPPESLTSALKGTSLLRHTLSLRTKLLEAVGPELQSADDPQHLWELSVWAQSVIMSRAFKIPKGSDRLVLIPIVDIANHAATHKVANADVRNNADGSISMVAVRDIAQGEEVRICYGEYTNEQLLFCYGFVIPDNPCQGLVCPLQFPDSPKRSELLHHCLAHRRQLASTHAVKSCAASSSCQSWAPAVPCQRHGVLRAAPGAKGHEHHRDPGGRVAGGEELGVIRTGPTTPGAGPMPRLFGGLATGALRSRRSRASRGLRGLRATAGGSKMFDQRGDGADRFTAAAAAVLEVESAKPRLSRHLLSWLAGKTRPTASASAAGLTLCIRQLSRSMVPMQAERPPLRLTHGINMFAHLGLRNM